MCSPIQFNALASLCRRSLAAFQIKRLGFYEICDELLLLSSPQCLIGRLGGLQ